METWRILRHLFPQHFPFFVGHGLFFYPNPARVFKNRMIDMWNLNIEINKNYHVFQSTVIRSHCQILGFVKLLHSLSFISGKKKNIAKRRICKHQTSLLMENGLVQDRNRLVKWSNSIKDGNKGTLQKKKTHMETGKSVDFASFLEMSEDDTTCLIVVIIYFLRSICSGIFVDTDIDSRRVPNSPFE